MADFPMSHDHCMVTEQHVSVPVDPPPSPLSDALFPPPLPTRFPPALLWNDVIQEFCNSDF
ncbi:hypothetical protein P389DRAFT_165014 [Cystobasidium minutum MCA 4210]|uniref:uncharacterized protein n=1 Tax=Cystobasidium minutum MCA 4210 TaxID=1397322 RepID=UPI0034CD824F|eukprot:jgi/Rhomi1/165014/fgenesh1_kg.1_\